MTTTIPTIDECRQFMDDYGMYDNIQHHSFVVAGIAHILIEGLRKALPESPHLPSSELVVAGALLHDIAKSKCLEEKCHHAEVGATICTELGLTELAEIVRHHVILPQYPMENYSKGIFTAKELVFYSDKRVNHHNIVSLDDRLEYILEKYSNNELGRREVIITNFKNCFELEQYLFSFLDFSPADLPSLLSRTPSDLQFPPS